MKKRYWKCNNCNDKDDSENDACYIALVDEADYSPRHCPFSQDETEAAWEICSFEDIMNNVVKEKTYKISDIKPISSFDPPKNWEVFSNLLNIKSITPNCAVCTWYRSEFHNDPEHFTYDVCAAQGAKDCDDVYNNLECKILFLNKHTM